MTRILLFIHLFFIFISAQSQSVGLALSGGGARGLAHIGLIKALEENNIPIDYIVGTSMGAIIGSLYAMGYSTDEMMEIFKSDDFKEWSKGEWPNEYNYYYRKGADEPDFFRINFERKDSFKLTPKIPVNLIPSGPLSYGFLKLYGQANSVAYNSFDSLMVPFRCVATNIELNKAKVFKKGDLGNSVRASMAFPFYYKPVTIDDTLYFDGGIVKNFPIDVLQDEFHPDYIIAQNVNEAMKTPTEDDLLTQIQNMIMIRSDIELNQEDGIIIQTLFDDSYLFDFEQLKFVVDSGYRNALAHMDEIKQHIHRSVSVQQVDQKRESFTASMPPLKLSNFKYDGLNTEQKSFFTRAMNYADTMSIGDYERIYYKLLASDHVKEIMPTSTFNDSTGLYDLKMNFEVNNYTTVKFGGNFSTGSANQGFLGIERRFLTRSAYTLQANFHFGQIYNAIKLNSRIDIEKSTPVAVELELIRQRWNYYETKLKYFFEGNNVSYLSDLENRFTLTLSTPTGINSKLFGRMDLALEEQEYVSKSWLSSQSSTLKSKFYLASPLVAYEYKTFDQKYYPLEGKHFYAAAKFVMSNEEQVKNNGLDYGTTFHRYPILKGRADMYFKFSKTFRLGAEAEYAYSLMDTMNTFTLTNLYSPAYLPTPLSHTQVLQPYRSPHYLSLGVKPVFVLNDNIHFRFGAYAMMPIKSYKETDLGNIQIDYGLKEVNFIGYAALVFQYPFGNISITADYFEQPVSNYFFNVNFGYLLFNRRATD